MQIDNLYIVLTNLPEYSSVCSSRDICQKNYFMNHNILPCILTACSFALNVNGQEMTNGNLIEEACFKNRAGFNIIEYVYDACGNVVGRRKKTFTNTSAYNDEERTISVQDANIFTLTPNPTLGVFSIYANDDVEKACTDFKLFTSSGYFVTSSNMQNRVCRFDISSLLPGLYFVQTFYGEELLIWKVIKR